MKNKLLKLRHDIAHRMGWFYGVCDAYYEGDRLMMSFICNVCGVRTGIHAVDNVIDRELDRTSPTNS